MSDKTDFQHEDDCPCFGDEVEHSIDCKNCTCDKSCKLPPEGWMCSRGYGHEGPCAARPRKLYAKPESVRAMEMPIPEDLLSELKGRTGKFIITGGRHLRYNSADQEALIEIFKPVFERLSTLQATVTRLSAPVSDEEIERYKWGFPDVVRDRFSEILRARTDQESKPSKEGQ